MYCPQCANLCDEHHKFCYHCGTPLPITEPEALAEESLLPMPEETTPELPREDEILPAPQEEAPAPQSAVPAEPQPVSAPPKPKGRLWPPILVMAIMLTAGFWLFFLVPGNRTDDTPWLSVENGAVYFHEDYYTGGSELEIPKVVDGQVVTSIASYGFADCDQFTTVTLPDSVRTISDGAFYGCDRLRGLRIPEGCRVIGQEVFRECPELEAVVLPSTLVSIGDNTFAYCTSLRYIFYTGASEDWFALYDGYINPGVRVYAEDGDFLHKNRP